MLLKICSVFMIILSYILITFLCLGGFVLGTKLSGSILCGVILCYIDIFIIFAIVRKILKKNGHNLIMSGFILYCSISIIFDVILVLIANNLSTLIIMLKGLLILCNIAGIYCLYKFHKSLNIFEEEIKIGVDI